MTHPSMKLTLTAAAAFADLPAARVRKEVEHGIIGAGPRPHLTFSDLVYLRTLRLLGLELGVADRKMLLSRIRAALFFEPDLDAIALSNIVHLELGATVRALTKTLKAFERWKRRLAQQDEIVGNEYLLVESHIPVREIARRAESGESTEAILKSDWRMTAEDVAFAQLFARAYPPAGRPRRARRARRAGDAH